MSCDTATSNFTAFSTVFNMNRLNNLIHVWLGSCMNRLNNLIHVWLGSCMNRLNNLIHVWLGSCILLLHYKQSIAMSKKNNAALQIRYHTRAYCSKYIIRIQSTSTLTKSHNTPVASSGSSIHYSSIHSLHYSSPKSLLLW